MPIRSDNLIGFGRTAEVYEWEQDQILKLYNKDTPIRAIQEEFEMSRFVYEHGVVTPKPYEIINVNERVGIVFQRIKGVSLLHMMTKKSPLRIKRHAQTMAALHAQLHGVRMTNDKLRKQKEVLFRNIQAAPLLIDAEKQVILSYLHDLPEGHKLCHGDFHPDNILLGEQNWTIDWMTGMAGNPSGDVARTMILLTYGTMPEGTPWLINRMVQGMRRKICRDYLSSYLKLMKLDAESIHAWILPVAAARLIEGIPQEEKQQILSDIRRRLSKLPEGGAPNR